MKEKRVDQLKEEKGNKVVRKEWHETDICKQVKEKVKNKMKKNKKTKKRKKWQLRRKKKGANWKVVKSSQV